MTSCMTDDVRHGTALRVAAVMATFFYSSALLLYAAQSIRSTKQQDTHLDEQFVARDALHGHDE